jgi:hypothetical protein
MYFANKSTRQHRSFDATQPRCCRQATSQQGVDIAQGRCCCRCRCQVSALAARPQPRTCSYVILQSCRVTGAAVDREA